MLEYETCKKYYFSSKTFRKFISFPHEIFCRVENKNEEIVDFVLLKKKLRVGCFEASGQLESSEIAF